MCLQPRRPARRNGGLSPRSRRGRRAVIRFRGDVEGLRAVAVLLVVLDHLDVPGFQGGFIGVDVFFVISGYLITSLIAGEYEKNAGTRARGSISIRKFYVRRARRILPAALTVVAAVVVASRLLLNPLRIGRVQHDALWAVFFGANVNSIHQATDYFDAGLAPSPFQHYWSLAVEEQFYVVWPALFLLVAWGPGAERLRRLLPWRGRVLVAIGALGAASLAWSLVTSAGGPAAYFSTLTRAWELALGAASGICATGATRLPRWLAAAASFGGVVLLAAGCALIDAGTPFPGAAALLPTVATALLVVAGLTERLPPANRALCLAPLRFVGRISYSVYLWHGPLVVFAAALYPATAGTLSARLLVLVLTLVVSTLCFYLVEQPGRRLSSVGSSGRPLAVGKLAAGTAVLVALFVGALSLPPRESGGAEVPAVVAATSRFSSHEAAAAGAATPYAEALRAWQRDVRAGLAVRTLPASLRPLQPHLVRYVEPYCNPRVRGLAAGECAVGVRRAVRVAVLTGDSHAGMFAYALSRLLGRGSWRLHVFQRGHCGWAGGVGPRLPVTPDECRADQARAASRIKALRPEVIVLSEEGVITPYRTEVEISSSLARFSRLARRVLVVGHTPTVPSFDSCLSGSADVKECVGELSASYRSDVRLEKRLTTRAGAVFVDTSTWFCVRVGRRALCPPVIDGAPVWRDGTHITSDLEPKLVPLLRAALGL